LTTGFYRKTIVVQRNDGRFAVPYAFDRIEEFPKRHGDVITFRTFLTTDKIFTDRQPRAIVRPTRKKAALF